MATFADGNPVPEDGQYHVDPTDPMVKVRCLEAWSPPGVTFLSGGNTACTGLLPDGTLLKYVWDRQDRHALHSLDVEHAILSALGQNDKIVKYLGKHDFGLLFQRAIHGDVRSYMSKHTDIPAQLRIKWIRQAAESLIYVHSKEVIHCDIHPNNFLLDEQLDLRLCDFAGSVFPPLNLDGGAMESTRFCLPRDWREPPNVTSDLFALGSAMFYITTGGYEPFSELPDAEVVLRFQAREFPDTRELKCGDAIRSCWMGDFKSAAGVLQAILEDVSRGSMALH